MIKEDYATRVQVTANNIKETLEILNLRISHGYMSIHERMQAEVFLKKISDIKDHVRQIQTPDDARQVIHLMENELYTEQNSEEEEIKIKIQDMLKAMSKAIIFYHYDTFNFLKGQVLKMLEFDTRNITLENREKLT